eukprot:3443715-Rhodomonas_salina.1
MLYPGQNQVQQQYLGGGGPNGMQFSPTDVPLLPNAAVPGPQCYALWYCAYVYLHSHVIASTAKSNTSKHACISLRGVLTAACFGTRPWLLQATRPREFPSQLGLVGESG